VKIFCDFPLSSLDLQTDLADFQQLVKENDGYRYLLVGVDVLSRRLFTTPVRSKSSEEMKQAFDRLFAQMPNLPSELYTDQVISDLLYYASSKFRA
jgi:hypothetical protein